MGWADGDPAWMADERPWDAPAAAFPHAILAGGDEVVAWVRDPVDAALIARSHNMWADLRPLGLRVVADSDQLRASLATQQAEIERLRAFDQELLAKAKRMNALADEFMALYARAEETLKVEMEKRLAWWRR